MPIDLPAAASFMTTHARVLDRRRFAVRFAGAGPDGALGALEGYRNADGGYGWGLEPELRVPESQPGGALHAFEVFEDIAPSRRARTPSRATTRRWRATRGSPARPATASTRSPRASGRARRSSCCSRSGSSTRSPTASPPPRRCSSDAVSYTHLTLPTKA